MLRKTILYTTLATVVVLLAGTGLEAGCGLGKRRSAGFYYSSPGSYSAGSGCVGYSAGCQGYQTAYYAAPVQSGSCAGYQAGSGCVGHYGAGNGILGRIRERRASRHYHPVQVIQIQQAPVQAYEMPKKAVANPDCKCGADCKCVDCVCGPDKVSQATTSDGKVISGPVYRWCDPVTGQCHLVQMR